MPETRESTRSLLRRAPRALMSAVVGARTPEVHPGVAGAVTGAAAAALIDEAAGAVVATGATGSARMAVAIGLAAAGERATVRLAGAELADAAELLAEAARRRLALVVDWRGGEKGEAPLARVLGSGAVVLVAADAQEAADLTLVARRVAEEGLVPVVVAQDGAETAASVQDVLLPEPGRAAAWLGGPGDRVHPPTAAQELLFGRHRRRLVRWHDPGRPMAQGVVLGAEGEGLAAAGRRAYLDEALPDLVERAFEDLARETGRRYRAVAAAAAGQARLVLVAHGSAAGTAEAAAGALRREGIVVGVAALRLLAPFPAAHLAEALRGVPAVAVLERLDAPLAEDGPVAREVRAALAWCQEAAEGSGAEGARPGRSLAAEVRAALSGVEGGGPPRRSRRVVGPAVASVLVPGLLRGSDLAALCVELLAGWRSPVHLGVPFDGGERGRYPKREVLQDALAAAYPEAARLGLRARAPGPDLRPAGALSVAVDGGADGATVAADASALLHGALGGRVRSRAGRLVWLAGPGARLVEPGADAPVDVAAWTGRGVPGRELVADLAPGGALLIPARSGGASDRADWWTALPAEVRDAVSARGLAVYTLDLGADDPEDTLLGALLGLLAKQGKVDVKPRRLLDARRQRLSSLDLDPAFVDRRLAGLQAGFDRVHAVPAAELAVRRTPAPEADPVPPAVRQASTGAGETVDSLPRFWDQVGVPAARGERALLTPDPYLATRTLPALSGALWDASAARTSLPAFDPAACTGCGACWTSCPHGAVEPAALGAAALLEHGMAAAKRGGAATDPLRMAVGKLAAAVTAELAAAGGGPAGPILDAAYDTVAARLPLPPERRAAVAEAFAAVRAELAHLPLAHAEPLAGAAFLLALDPDRCTGCGICVAACEPGALTAAADTPARTRDARRLARTLQELPDTAAETVAAVRHHPAAGPLAGALLPRGGRRLAGAGDGAEPGSGEALAVRQVLGAAAHHLEPLRRRRAEDLEALAEELAGAIHGDLSNALPDRDLDAMARGLAVLERPASDLAELTGRIQAVLTDEREGGRVDVARLRRLVDVAREVADLRLHLGAAAPFGLVLAGGPATWGATFPYQPFAVPATVAPPCAAPAVARGLADAACREAVAAARKVRAAREVLAAVTPSEAARAEDGVRALRGLSWTDLDAAERRFATPVFVLASEAALAADLTGLLELLASDLPVAVLALSPDGASSPLADLLVAWAAAGTMPGVVLGQATVAHGERVDAAVAAALALDASTEPAAALPPAGPALLRLLAPLPSRGGFAPDRTLARARDAVADRSFPLFLRSPGEGGVPTLDLAGNPPEETGAAAPPAWAALRRAAGSTEAFAAAAGAEDARRAGEAAERRHREEVDALRAGYEARVREVESGARVALAREVRGRLLALATKTAGGLDPALVADAGGVPEGS